MDGTTEENVILCESNCMCCGLGMVFLFGRFAEINPEKSIQVEQGLSMIFSEILASVSHLMMTETFPL
jgi:hypothetical protein